MWFDSVVSGSLEQLMAPLVPSARIFYLYLLAAFVLAMGTYFYFSYREESARPDGIKKGLFAYIFDPAVWFHRSAQQDYLFFIFNAVIYYGLIAQLMITGHFLYNGFGQVFESLFGVREAPIFEGTTMSSALYTLAVVLALDLAVYLTHYLQHKVQVLWQFHKVHHSAEVLTPVTVYRMHPVDLFFTGIIGVILIAVAFAFFSYATDIKPSEITVLNVNIVLFVFYLIGYNLRHSHIWLSYPPWVSYILISPAQHQTHHSVDPKHFDRNFGLIFAFWDWLFGTLYVPRKYEKLEFGLDRDEPNPFSTVSEIYLKPFAMAWALIFPEKSGWQRRIGYLGALGLIVFFYVGIYSASNQALSDQRALSEITLQDMTWTEVSLALERGYDTVVVPTGGTEQNGPHVILGKHNYIVAETSRQIAERLGNALVAPVVAYVPEGATGDSPDGHMQWPGTISVPEEIFEGILEHTARSLETHGFKRIIFIGDSGGNQAAQDIVATALSSEWREKGVKVINAGDYYSQNDQVAWLGQQGFSEEEIGYHAGIRDTSELMKVHPPGVRSSPVPGPTGVGSGFSGAIENASPDLGAKMIELKVEAALAQIRRLKGS